MLIKHLTQSVWPLLLLTLAITIGNTAFAQSGTVTSDPTARYRTRTVDPQVRRVPAAVQRGALADPARYLEPLVQALTVGIDDDFRKVKILHDWIAENVVYDVESFLAGTSASSSWENTLRTGKGVCHGYSQVMVTMCAAAGIPCETIAGYGRGYGYLTGSSDNPGRRNHAWNAVQIGGRWYLVDVTWDAGHVDGRTYRKRYRTTYLFLDPALFLYTHFPEDPKWQLLNPARTAEQFAGLPYLRGRFFEHGLRLVTPLRRVSHAGSSVQFALDVPDEVGIMVQLKGDSGAELPLRTLVRRQGRRCHVLATFPSPGRWEVYVHSRRRDDPGAYYLAASLQFDCTAGTTRTFPKTYSAYGDFGGWLHSPLYLPLSTDGPLTFKVGLTGTSEVHLAIDKKPWIPLQPVVGQANVYQVTPAVPPGSSVRLTTKKPDGSYTTLVDFNPTPTAR